MRVYEGIIEADLLADEQQLLGELRCEDEAAEAGFDDDVADEGMY